MIPNNAGGFVFDVGTFKQLERFLVLGSEGGTYYVTERKLTKANAVNTIKAIEADGKRAVDLIVAVSDRGRAVKNDPAIFALALAASAKDKEVRAYALANLGRVCRIPTHLFHFITYVEQFRGWGRGLKKAVGSWYNEQEVEKLAYQVVKYQSRDGWSNADVLRKAHVNPDNSLRSLLYKWIVDGKDGFKESPETFNKLPEVVRAHEVAKLWAQNKGAINLTGLIENFNLTREMLPTEALSDPTVWEALLSKMPLTAMLRNLGNMSKVGLLTPYSDASKLVVAKLTDREALKKARVHPVGILLALKNYGRGKGLKGSGVWTPVTKVTDALDDAFYSAFEFVEPTGQSFLLGVDVSASMQTESSASGISAAEGAAAMALSIVRVESDYEVVLFDTRIVEQVKITKKMTLKQVEDIVNRYGGGTDCSQPIQWAKSKRLKVDNIVILTDNETWAGRYGHPVQWMREYRNVVNQSAKIVNVGMTATECSINDPDDNLALDVAGFDTTVPAVIADFVKEN